ncbi:MAG: hypothetical protein GY699_19005 [Desulfobacteraceae bacterium]|nr:hypothetical protein [Desulfobacteraceae bacterium]
MKKLLLSLCSTFLMFCLFSTAMAATVGNTLEERRYVDGWSNFNVIDTSLQFSDSGKIDSWSIFFQHRLNDPLVGIAPIYFQVLRNVTGSTYEIIGENLFYGDGNNVGIQTFSVAEPDKITYEAGDYIGWAFDGYPVFGFDFGGDTTLFPAADVNTTGVGSVVTFTYTDSRTYSISVETSASTETSAVPIPAAIVLLGSGLIGLLGINRKKREY